MFHEPGEPYDTPTSGEDDSRTLALPEPTGGVDGIGRGLVRAFGGDRWQLPAVLFTLALLLYGAFACGRGLQPPIPDIVPFACVVGYFAVGTTLFGSYARGRPAGWFRPALVVYGAVGWAGLGAGWILLESPSWQFYLLVGYVAIGNIPLVTHLLDSDDGPSRGSLLAYILLGSLLFGTMAIERVTGPTRHTHFAYQAQTFNSMLAATVSDDAAAQREGLHPFEIQRRPPHQNDWASWWEVETDRRGRPYRGFWLDGGGDGRFQSIEGPVYYISSDSIISSERRYFVSFPPGPSVLMMPLAAVWGYEVNDVLFTLVFAAFNVLLVYLVLRRLSRGGRSGRSRSDNLWLTALFALGTAHLWCSTLGQVWFTGLVVGVTFALLYLYLAADARHPLLAGLALAFGFATRTPLVFASVFFFAFLAFPGGRWRRDGWRDAARRFALFCLPCLVVGVSLLVLNEIRFGHPTHFGHRYLAGGTIARIKTWGLFHTHFLWRNVWSMWLLLPRISLEPPYIEISRHGMSLLVTSPAFLYLLAPESSDSAPDKFWWRVGWLTVAVTALPALFYQNTGRFQFGYRFVMDYLPFLIVLLAVGRRQLGWLFKSLVVAGFIVNGFGAVTFKRAGMFYKQGFFVSGR